VLGVPGVPPAQPMRRESTRVAVLYARASVRYDGRVTPKTRILVVDDDPEITAMLARSLGRQGFEIDATSSAEEALARSASASYAAAILDLVMPGRDGADLAAALREKIPGLPIALLTGYTQSPLIEAARRQPATAVFTKPVSIGDLADFLKAEIR